MVEFTDLTPLHLRKRIAELAALLHGEEGDVEILRAEFRDLRDKLAGLSAMLPAEEEA